MNQDFLCLSSIQSFLANRDPNNHDFGIEWNLYWKQRMSVYYDKDLKRILDKIGGNYKSTVSDVNGTEHVDAFDAFDIDNLQENDTRRFATPLPSISEETSSIGEQIIWQIKN